MPCSCSGANSYLLNDLIYQLDGYADNTIVAIYINGVNINASNLPSGGATFQGGNQIVLSFPGPWNAGDNTIEILLENGRPSTVSAGQEGLLLTGSQSGASLFPTPIADFNSNSTSCAVSYARGQNIGFTSTSTAGNVGIANYLWSFSPSATPSSATTQNASAFFTGTTGTALLRITDNNGCTASTSCSFTLAPPTNCSATFTVNNASQCFNVNSFVLTNTSATSPNGSIMNYSWNFGAGATPASASTVGPHTVTYSTAGIKTISLTITDSNGCTSTVSQNVAANPMVTVTAAAAPTAICNGQTNTTLTATPSGGSGFTYVWSNAAGSSQSVVVSPSTNTTYRVTVTNSNGCTGTASTLVTLNVIPSLSLSSTATNGVNIACFGGNTGSITTSVAGGAPFGYTWNGPTVIPANTANPSGLSVGTYRVTVTNANGCTATSSMVLTQPTQALTAGTCNFLTDRCQLRAGQFQVQAQGGVPPYNVSWNPNQGAPASPASIATNGGLLVISGLTGGALYDFTVTDANGCLAP